MAAVTQEVFSAVNRACVVSAAIDDVTAVLTNVAWSNTGGPLSITIITPGHSNITVSRAAGVSGSQLIPVGGTGGGYAVSGLSNCGFQIAWNAA